MPDLFTSPERFLGSCLKILIFESKNKMSTHKSRWPVLKKLIRILTDFQKPGTKYNKNRKAESGSCGGKGSTNFSNSKRRK